MDFRRHALSFLALCVALAAGLALGSGPLQRGNGGDDASRQETSNEQLLRARADALRANGALDRSMAAALGPGLVKGRLPNRLISIIALPDVDQEVIDSFGVLVTAAGGQIANIVNVQPQTVDAGKKTYVESVADGAIKGQADLAPTAGLSAYEKLAAVFSRAYVGKAGAATDPESVDIDAELQGAELVTLQAPLSRRGNLVLVLASGEHGATSRLEAEHVIVSAMLKGLAAASDGVLLATGAGGHAKGGLISELLAADGMDRISTIDAIDSPTGRIAAVYALGSVATGKPGHYRAVGPKQALPPGFPVQATP